MSSVYLHFLSPEICCIWIVRFCQELQRFPCQSPCLPGCVSSTFIIGLIPNLLLPLPVLDILVDLILSSLSLSFLSFSLSSALSSPSSPPFLPLSYHKHSVFCNYNHSSFFWPGESKDVYCVISRRGMGSWLPLSQLSSVGYFFMLYAPSHFIFR